MAVPGLVAQAEEPRRALLPILTHSALSAARACMRLYRNRYVLRLRSLRAEADKTELGDLGRVLVRPSGTEAVVRVMVEASDPGQVDEFTARIAGAIEREIG